MAPTLQVEVNIQDCFFGEQESDRTIKAPVTAAQNVGSPISIDTWQTWFQHWLAAMEPQLTPNNYYELSLRLTDDAEIQQFNAQYRQKDQPTDVLAFASLEVETPSWENLPPDLPLYLGDILISVETAQRQAQQQGHALTQELAWLAAHALLHLLGWDHPDDTSLEEMLQQQAVLLQTIGLSSGYYHGEPEPM